MSIKPSKINHLIISLKLSKYCTFTLTSKQWVYINLVPVIYSYFADQDYVQISKTKVHFRDDSITTLNTEKTVNTAHYTKITKILNIKFRGLLYFSFIYSSSHIVPEPTERVVVMVALAASAVPLNYY